MSRPTTVVASLLAFVLGGLVPAALHGPPVVHRAGHEAGVCSHIGTPPVAAPPAASCCPHDATDRCDDAAESDQTDPPHECPVCDLLATACVAGDGPVGPIGSDAVVDAVAVPPAAAVCGAFLVFEARGPPTPGRPSCVISPVV